MPNSPQHRDAETVVESITVNINSKRPEVSLVEPQTIGSGACPIPQDH